MRLLMPTLIASLGLAWPLESAMAGPLSPHQQTCLRKAQRHEKQGWIYLHVEGAPGERGFQHGYLLAKDTAECLRVRRRMWEYQSGMEWPWLVAQAKALLTPKVDAE